MKYEVLGMRYTGRYQGFTWNIGKMGHKILINTF